jgi:hypothetical protein
MLNKVGFHIAKVQQKNITAKPAKGKRRFMDLLKGERGKGER